MMRNPSSLRSAHLVMWSSPLLLLVLVLTLTSTTSTHTKPPTRHSAQTSTAPTSPQRPPVTTVATTTASTTTVTSLSTPPVTAVTPFAKATDSIAKPAAATPVANVSNGVLSGVLSRGFHVADVPIEGPGRWTLSTSAPIRALLHCAAGIAAVENRIVIRASESCQLQLTSTSPEVSPTWQLTPIR